MKNDLDWPLRNRSYHHHHFDGAVWDEVIPRDDDIVIASSVKSGSTWLQQIIATLVFEGRPHPAPLNQFSLFLDLRVPSRSERLAIIAGQSHRRIYKTHLPLDGLLYFPQCKYVYIARDGRDVFMSLWHHYRSANALWYQLMNDTPDRVGEPLPPCPDDIHTFWRDWISRGWFEWEEDGYPFWSVFRHVHTWWQYRQLPNLLFLHYADLKRDIRGQSRRIADFLGIQATSAVLDAVAEQASFGYMKKHAGLVAPLGGQVFTGGAETFIHKGTNRRWQGVLSDEELAQYDRLVSERLSPDCAHWLATGQP